MADFNFSDVASKTQAPQGMGLADIMNFAKNAQAYQQAQQVNPLQAEKAGLDVQQAQQLVTGGNLELQQKQQGFNESQNLQKYFSNPENYMKDGKINLEKINQDIPRIAPLTGSEHITKLTTLATAQTTADKAKQDLNQDQRKIVAGPIAILGRMGIKNKSVYISELDNLLAQNPNNASLEKLIDSYKKILGNVNPDQLPTLAIKGSQSLLSPTEQEEKLGQKAGTLDVGGQYLNTLTTPSVGGMKPSIQTTGTLAEKTLAPTTFTSETGEPKIIGGGSNQNVSNTGPLPESLLSTLPTGKLQGNVSQNLASNFEAKGGLQRAPDETYGAYKARTERLASLPEQSKKAMNLGSQDSVLNQEYTNDKILKLLEKKNLDIGPIQNAIANKTGGLGLSSDQQEIIKYLEQRIRQESSRSNQDENSQRKAYGSFGTSKDALLDILYNDKGNLASQKLYHQGILKNQGNPSKPNLSAINNFENKFVQENNDPNVIHLLGVIGKKSLEQLSPLDVQHLKKAFGGLNKDQLKELFDKKERLEALVSGAQ